MSVLTINQLQAPVSAANVIVLGSGNTFNVPGNVIQTVFSRTDARTTYSSAATGNGTTITDLNITVVPKFSTSLILLTWMINCEISAAWDNVFLIHKDGALITTSGYQGYNNVSGNVRWSGIMAGAYDNDNGSTISNYRIQYAVPAESTTSRVYAPAIRSSNASAQTLYLNRTVGSTGATNYEVTVSNVIAMEIGQ